MDTVERSHISYSNNTVYHSTTHVLQSVGVDRLNEAESVALISKIRHYMHANEDLRSKQAHLESTLKDLRDLTQSTSTESEQYFKQLGQQNKQMKEKSERAKAALKAHYKSGAHLETVSLYWRDFVNASQ